MGKPGPFLRTALNSVPLMSMFKVSPNSYGFEIPPDSIPVVKSRFHPRLIVADLATRRFRGWRRHARVLLLPDEALLFHALNELVDEVTELLILRDVGVLQQPVHHFG